VNEFIIPFTTPPHFLKILCAKKNGLEFKEFANIKLDNNQIKFSFELKSQLLSKIKIIPLNSPHILHITEFSINNTPVSFERIRSNAFRIGESLLFDKPFPFMEIDVENNPAKINLIFIYVINNIDIINYIRNLKVIS
jgi:hypothetical protein